MGIVDILRPVGKPRHCGIMFHSFPLARDIGLWNGSIFANVDSDILWANSKLCSIDTASAKVEQ